MLVLNELWRNRYISPETPEITQNPRNLGVYSTAVDAVNWGTIHDRGPWALAVANLRGTA